jgi:hypothetical protein
MVTQYAELHSFRKYYACEFESYEEFIAFADFWKAEIKTVLNP